MKVLLTIWISAVLIQEVVPSTLVRYPRQASNTPSFLHTEYEAKIEQKGKHGNESFGMMSGKQAIEHDNCNDNWNAFANKCAALIKDLVASLANSVSSKPGDATNLQLHIKNTFRHLDNTHNCSCLNHTGKGLSDMDLSQLFDNLTLSTAGPVDDNDEGYSDKDNEEHSSMPGVNSHLKKLTPGANVNPESEEDPNSTSNSRRQAAQHGSHPSGNPKSNDITSLPSVVQNSQGRKGVFHPFLTTSQPSSDFTSDATSTSSPLYYTNKHSPLESSSIKKSSAPHGSEGSGNPSTWGDSHRPESNPVSEAPLEIEPELIMTSGKNRRPMEKARDAAGPSTFPAQTSIPVGNLGSQNVPPENFSTPPVKTANGMKLERPNDDYDEPTSYSTEHTTSAKPKHDDDSSSVTDPHSYESPDYDSPIEASKPSKDDQPTRIPVTNTHSNIPELSESTTSHNSLSSGTSPCPSDENSHTEDIENDFVGRTSNSELTTTECSETSGPDTVTTPSIFSESPTADEIEGEILITPRPMIGSQAPAIEKQYILPKTPPPESETSDSDEGCSTTPESIYPTDEQAVTKAPLISALPDTSEKPHVYGTTSETTEKSDEEIEHFAVTIVPVEPSSSNDNEPTENKQEVHTTVTPSSLLPLGGETTDNSEGDEDHTEMSENPVLVQPTTFQTTSEDPTHSPMGTQISAKFIPVTTVSTPQDSDEGTTSESKHEKHHDHDDEDDDEDDCCSCESCADEEESDPRKVRENVCKSLEEARKELKAIFDKIKKKLRCCRKMPHAITTNSSPLPQ